MAAKKKPVVNPPRPLKMSVCLSKDEQAALDQAAAEQGVSRSDVLRGALRNYPRPVSRRA